MDKRWENKDRGERRVNFGGRKSKSSFARIMREKDS